jgi:hypothetical protein
MLRIALVLLLVLCQPASAQQEPAVSRVLQAAIGKLSPGAKILRADQVDDRECNVSNNPGLARGDFNGDGFEDAAALLVTRIANEVSLWEGREFRKADFQLALFIADGKGRFRARTVDRYSDQIPTAVVLSVTGPGTIFSLENKANKTVLKNPAFVIHFCGKSSAAYVVTGDRVKEIPLSD